MTNTLAICLVAADVPHTQVGLFATNLDGLKLESPPILADSDFVAWDVTNQTFAITPAAAMRVAARCHGRVIPFVLLAHSDRVYLGKFDTLDSSVVDRVPVIYLDSIVSDCFMGYAKVPTEINRMLAVADPKLADRLYTMTNAMTNVVLEIHRGMSRRSDADPRVDQRITAAVERLSQIRKK